MKKIFIFPILFIIVFITVVNLKNENNILVFNDYKNSIEEFPIKAGVTEQKRGKLIDSLTRLRDGQITKLRIFIIKAKKDIKERNKEKIEEYKSKIKNWEFCKEIFSIYKFDNLIFNKDETKSKNEVVQDLYKNCSMLEEEINSLKTKEEKLSNLDNYKDIREISLDKNKRKIIFHKQNKNENTCVIDNLTVALEYETGIKLNKNDIYNKMWKTLWEFWNWGLYWIGEYGWFLQEISKWEVIEFEGLNYSTKSQTGKLLIKQNVSYKELPEAKDYTKFENISWYSLGKTPNIEYAILMLENKKALIMEIPMKVIYKNMWYENSKLFHAITIYSYDKNTRNFTFLNTLSWKLEKINLREIEWEQNKSYSKYLFFFFTNI